MASASCTHTVEEVFQDLKGRRAGLIKALTTVVDAEEVVTDAAKKQVEEKSSVSNHRGSKSNSSSIVETLEDDDSVFCGVCCIHNVEDGFWIFCDFCESWYHGRCVEVTPDLAKSINKYKCGFCQLHFG